MATIAGVLVGLAIAAVLALVATRLLPLGHDAGLLVSVAIGYFCVRLSLAYFEERWR